MTPEAEVIKRLVAIYGEPKTGDPEAFLEEFAKAISGYSRESLHRACDRVIKACTFWPKPAELLEHLRAKIQTTPDFPNNDWSRDAPTPESRARCNALMADLRRALSASTTGEAPRARLPDVDRPAFEEMRERSPLHHLHRVTLSQRSRSMSGDRE